MLTKLNTKIILSIILTFLLFQPLAFVLAQTTTTIYPSKYYNIDSSGKVTKHIFANGIEIAVIEGTGSEASVKYVHTDNLGSTNVITDDTGAIVETTDYYPYGSIRTDQKVGNFSEQRKYIGQEYDETTGLNYLNARYYDSAIGKFLNEDPMHWTLPQELLLDPQQQNSPRTMGGLNSASAFGWRKNTQSRAGSMSGWAEFLTDPQMQNSYSYGRNNPITMSDPNGEWAVYISPVIPGINVGLGGEAGNSWAIGFASDGTFGLSSSVHGGGLAGVDASINWTAGYSNAKTWSDTLGTGQYASVGGKIIGGGSITTNYSDGKYTGTDISIGLGARGLPDIPVAFSGGASKTTPVFQGSLSGIVNGVKNAVNSAASAVGQGVKTLINKLR